MQTEQLQGDATVLASGTVIALAYSIELQNNIRKQTHDTAQVTRWGIPGDKHYGETRSYRGHPSPNNRPISVVGVEAGRAACAELNIPDIQPGGLGENILTEGLGDLSGMVAEDEIHIFATGEDREPAVIFKVRKQNTPCANTLFYHKEMIKTLMGRRGVLCTVLKEGTVNKGDRVAWVRRG